MKTAVITGNMKWGLLRALQLGEKYEVDIPPTREEVVRKIQPTQRTLYRRAQHAAYHLSKPGPGNPDNQKFVVRLGDFRIPAERDKAYIWCIELNGKKADYIPPAQGFRGAIIKDERKKAKVAALPAQIEEERKVMDAQRRENATTLPPHVHIVTADNIKHFAKIVAAHARGEEIEFFDNGKWLPLPTPTPQWHKLPLSKFRIKPEPARELWVLFERGHVGDWAHKLAVFTQTDKPDNLDPECLIHYREVPPDEEDT